MSQILVVGSLNMDMTVEIPHFPLVGETILADRFYTGPGGKGANQAYAIGKLGGNVGMLGAVGNDDFGKTLLSNLSDVNVDISGVATKDNQNTGRAIINVNKHGDNNIVVVPGANAMLSVDDIRKHMRKIEQCDIVILQMEIPLETISYVIKAAAEAGKTVILDPAPAIEHFPKTLYPLIDIIKPNETELGILLGDKTAVNYIEESTKRLREWGVKNVVVTLGERGAYLDAGDGFGEFLPVKNVRVVDSTAAGDTFIAAMALKLLAGVSLREAAMYANKVSTIVVTRKGAQSSIPTRDEIHRIA